MKEFQPFTLEDLNISFIDGDRGKNYPSQHDFSDKGYSIFLTTKNVRKYGFDFSDIQYISKEKDSALRKGKVQDKDIILTTRGTVGNTAYYEQSIHYENVRINSGMVIVRPDEKTVDSRFLLYFFRSLDYDIFVSGSAQPQLPIRDLKKIKIHLPPLIEQKAIASVLSSFDDKIDLLHRQNKTLESMAETLFRQWFIVNEQEHWLNGTIEDLYVLQRGFDLPSNQRVSGEFNLYAASGLNDNIDSFKVDYPTIITGRSGVIGKVYYSLEKSWPLNTTLYIKDFKISTFWFAYFHLKTLDLASLNSGSAVPTLNRNHVHSLGVKLPPKDLISKFEDEVSVFMIKFNENLKQILNLEKLRDTLLPKLMSGEVRVQYAEKAIALVA
ncbi:MAG: restriction modification system specificity domain protein [Proteobacteria bacterium]|nr:restriction modification system specificity domain protein [Pseudomonadota bacterium]